MEELNIDTSKLFPVTVDGDRMEFRLPTLNEQIAYEEKMEQLKDSTKDLFQMNTEFLIELGGKRDVLEKLPSKYFLQILDGLIEFGKKK